MMNTYCMLRKVSLTVAKKKGLDEILRKATSNKEKQALVLDLLNEGSN